MTCLEWAGVESKDTAGKLGPSLWRSRALNGGRRISPIKIAAGWLERFPDTPALFERRLSGSWAQYAVLLLLGLSLRIATFGDPNLHLDESFYFLVGQEMHHGALPYVDIWDRKPLGLFLIYYLIAGISTSVVAYQVAAWLFASSTAMAINLIAQRWANVQGGMFAGGSYLFMLGLFEGWGGQGPIFYNLFIATAALLILDDLKNLDSGRPRWRTFAAMALCGLALTIKQTVFFEAVFFGLLAAHRLWRRCSGAAMAITLSSWILLGCLPTLIIGLFYFQAGHWFEYWQAMVTSNLEKKPQMLLYLAYHVLRMVLRLYPLLALAIAGLLVAPKDARAFLTLWLTASFLGMLAIPNFYGHYALPFLVPLSVTSALIFRRRDVGVFLAVWLVAFTMVIYNPFNFTERRLATIAMNKMAAAIRKHDTGGGLFVSDGPIYLYALAGKHPPSALAFTPHLNEWRERNSSQFNVDEEVRKVLGRKPGVVVISVFSRTDLSDGRTRRATLAYVQNNCRLVEVQTSYEVVQSFLIAVYGDCREGAPDMDSVVDTVDRSQRTIPETKR